MVLDRLGIKSAPYVNKVKFSTISGEKIDLLRSYGNLSHNSYIPKSVNNEFNDGSIRDLYSKIAASMDDLAGMVHTQLSLQKEVCNVVNDLSANYIKLAEALQDGIKKLQAELQAQMKAAEEKSGILGIIFGIVEAVVGVCALVFSGGSAVGAVIGAIMLLNGITKMGAGAAVLSDPSGALDNQMENDFISNGIFETLNLATNSSDAAGKAQSAFNILTVFINFGDMALSLAKTGAESAGENLANAGRSLISAGSIATGTAKVLLLLNELTMLVGSIYGVFASSDNSDENDIGVATSLSMGLFAFSLYEVLHSLKADKALADKLGSSGAELLETGMFMMLNISAMALHGKLVLRGSAASSPNIIQSRLQTIMHKLKAAVPIMTMYQSIQGIDNASQQYIYGDKISSQQIEQAEIQFFQKIFGMAQEINQGQSSLEQDLQGDLEQKVQKLMQVISEIYQLIAKGISASSVN
jgi:hypothetical protein